MSSNTRFHAWPLLVVAAILVPGAFDLASFAVQARQVERTATALARKFFPDDPLLRDHDMRDIPPVADYELSKSYDFLRHTFVEMLDAGPAQNVNTLGDVPDSSWFTNRIGMREMSMPELLRGPDSNDGPAAGIWEVTGRPDAGLTPKFRIKDSRGHTYLIKLDPADYPELPSSVEVLSTKIFHAIGYHVPEDFIVHFDPARLRVAPGAKLTTADGSKRAIQPHDIVRWLRLQPRRPDGTIRALASRYLPGKVVGSFQFTGTRSDDPNDIFPHENRRELRGLHVFSAWLNHDDARSLNSLDAYVEEDGRRYIRHYLQDFGSNLGSGSTSAQQPRGGYEYLIERGPMLKGLGGLGFWTRGWMAAKYPEHPSLGNIEADFFDPATWKTEYPQPAFLQMDAVDAFWAARIVAKFTDPMIAAIVRTGQLSDPDAERVLTDIIVRRRDKVVAYWLTKTNPLDTFVVTDGTPGPVLTFDDAAIRARVVSAGTSYMVSWFALDNMRGTEQAAGERAFARDRRAAIPADVWGPVDDNGDRYAVARIQTFNAGYREWERPIAVTIRQRGVETVVVGIDRPSDGPLRAVRARS